jgi:3-isopropylmalate dehydratase/3-isopropylmalate/(R)-2-methylmalate dehydratase small subunit
MGECLGGNHMVSVDLAAQTVTSPSGKVFAFQIDASRKAKMLQGLDAIGETLTAASDIDAWEARRALTHPWLERAG